MTPPRPAPPVAKRAPVELTQLGRARTDPYAWLKDENWQAVMRDPALLRADIRAYLEAENAYCKAVLEDPTEALRETLLQEIRGRIKEDDSSVPAVDGPYAYGSRYREGGEYPIFTRRPAARAFDADAPEDILYDGDKEAEGAAYFDIGDLEHSPDHKKIAYALDTQGSEYYTIRVRDAASGEDLGVEIAQSTGDFVWGAGSNVLFWVKRDENGRPCAVYQRKIGETEDTLVYEEPDPGFFVGLGQSQSSAFIFIDAHDHTTSEVRFFPAGEADPDLRLIAPRDPGVEYSVDHQGDRFLILTNADGAVDFKIVSAPVDTPERENWVDETPHRPGVLLLDLIPFADFVARLEREDALPRIAVRQVSTGEEHVIAFEEAAYSLGAQGGYEYDTTTLRFGYASPATPNQVFDYDMATRERTLRKTREVPSGHDPADYVVERLMAPAHDGETIPVTLLRRRSTPVDGTAPVFLSGYGAYGITMPADFGVARLSLVDRGFVYALAHTRGGQAKGYQWYLDGKLSKKENTFQDYLSAARFLCETGHGAPGRIVGYGGSAGGLLMGAAANLAPELFAAIIAAVPFVDVLNTMSDADLPLTPPEWPEWGDPTRDAAAYDAIAAYSPYDNVSDKPYPPMLITAGLSDPRVTYWEPAKWAAKLRHEAPGAGPYLLRTNMEAGHGGATGRFEGLKETALEFAFALAAVGLAEGVSLHG